MQPEISKVREDVANLLTDLRGTIDEALVQLNLGEKNLRDVMEPVINEASNIAASVRSRING
jgi:hypothetical protein